MIDYSHLIGRPFKWRERDCYALLCDFYRDIFDIELPVFARPEDFYSHGLNLFGENYRAAGFKEINVHPSEIRFGDVAVSAIDSTFGNHCSIFVENDRILHHLHGRLSGIMPFRGLVRNTCIGIYRHKDVSLQFLEETESQDIRAFLSPSKQKQLDELRSANTGPQEQAG